MAEPAISPPDPLAPPGSPPPFGRVAPASRTGPADPLAPRGIPLTGVRRRLSRAAVSLVALLAAVHAAMLLLHVASDFPLAKRYAEQVDWWMRPMFPQDWSIFAPDPSRYNLHLEARTRVGGTFGPWRDLSAYDHSRYRGDLLPSIEEQLVLRRAVSYYQASDARPDSGGADATRDTHTRYLLNVVRIRLHDMGAPLGDAVELRTRSTRIPAPEQPGAVHPPRYRTLGIWELPS
ncbi:DUF5819 family protein [Streptomyces candidus]|uniref:Uncharacterized protein n=1 Tax=Streptomyces candidus TaxID=67283 RepID=A0A7X0LPJ9_9ACTN|nr:DUF5819 family protein [Streptomyces candidus]MBB6436603.1 hypothetical protein [Streptomyces candidus]GHH50731.1 hypothetical protein GCM10018773_48160 [Streptomyces candidus]